jgi:drug/metabolite transporter (DMT)-like permease
MTLVGSSVAAASTLADYPILGGQAVRYALGSGLLFLWARRNGTSIVRPGPRDLGWLSLTALIGMAGFNVLLIAGTARTDPSLVGAIVGTAPIPLAILGALQAHRRPGKGLLAGAALVAVGTVIIEQARLAGDNLGVVLAICAMLGEVGFSLLAVPVLKRIGPLAVAAHGTWLAALMLVAGAIVVDGSTALRVPTLTESSALLYLALAVTAAGFVMWYTAVDRLGADTAGLFAGLIPVSALAASAAIGTDQLSTSKLVGALVVGLGVVFGVNRSTTRRKLAIAERQIQTRDATGLRRCLPSQR